MGLGARRPPRGRWRDPSAVASRVSAPFSPARRGERAPAVQHARRQTCTPARPRARPALRLCLAPRREEELDRRATGAGRCASGELSWTRAWSARRARGSPLLTVSLNPLPSAGSLIRRGCSSLVFPKPFAAGPGRASAPQPTTSPNQRRATPAPAPAVPPRCLRWRRRRCCEGRRPPERAHRSSRCGPSGHLLWPALEGEGYARRAPPHQSAAAPLCGRLVAAPAPLRRSAPPPSRRPPPKAALGRAPTTRRCRHTPHFKGHCRTLPTSPCRGRRPSPAPQRGSDPARPRRRSSASRPGGVGCKQRGVPSRRWVWRGASLGPRGEASLLASWPCTSYPLPRCLVGCNAGGRGWPVRGKGGQGAPPPAPACLKFARATGRRRRPAGHPA
jgi:hypothetical protein